MAKACISTMGDKIIGYNLPNGEESLLFNELLKITGNGDIALNLYKQTRTEAFQLRKYHYELDKNEEPVIKNRYYGSTTHVEDYFIDPKAPIKFQHKTVNDIKPGVEELFNSNPELANIGTPQQYSLYLDTIFPDSQVKDIVYKGGNGGISSEQYFSKQKEYAERYGNVKPYIVNLINPIYFDKGIHRNSIKDVLNDRGIIGKDYDGSTSDSIIEIMNGEEPFSNKGKYDVIVVNNIEQIHILGSKQDIEGFKEFVLTNKPKPKSLKEIAEFYNVQNTSFFNSTVDSAKLRAEVNKLGYELVENPNKTFHIAKNGKMVKFYSTTKTPKRYIEQMEMVEVNPETSWENKKSLLTQIFPDMTKEEWNDYPELIRQQMLNCI